MLPKKVFQLILRGTPMQHRARLDESSALYRRWTTTAIECFTRNCECEGCYYSTLQCKCKMKETVEILYKRLGEPPIATTFFGQELTQGEAATLTRILQGDLKPRQAPKDKLFRIAAENGLQFGHEHRRWIWEFVDFVSKNRLRAGL